jgi:hypothetical protein
MAYLIVQNEHSMGGGLLLAKRSLHLISTHARELPITIRAPQSVPDAKQCNLCFELLFHQSHTNGSFGIENIRRARSHCLVHSINPVPLQFIVVNEIVEQTILLKAQRHKTVDLEGCPNFSAINHEHLMIDGSIILFLCLLRLSQVIPDLFVECYLGCSGNFLSGCNPSVVNGLCLLQVVIEKTNSIWGVHTLGKHAIGTECTVYTVDDRSLNDSGSVMIRVEQTCKASVHWVMPHVLQEHHTKSAQEERLKHERNVEWWIHSASECFCMIQECQELCIRVNTNSN